MEGSQMNNLNWKRFAVVFGTILLCVGCDQTTKAIARAALPESGVLSFVGDAVKLRYAENKGAVLAFES